MNDLCLFSLDFLIYLSIIRYILKAKVPSSCEYKIPGFEASAKVLSESAILGEEGRNENFFVWIEGLLII